MDYTLITGAAGFIGSHVAKKLLEQGHAVVAIDNLNDYYPVKNKRRNLLALQSFANFQLIEGDLAEQSCVDKLFSDFSIKYIGHLAARAGVRPSIADPRLYERANIQGTLNLLDAARRSNKVANFVLTSSSSVYGNSTQVPFNEQDAATDRPISPYAATKKATELLGYTFHHLYGLNINVVRPFTVYGPCGRPDMAPWLFLESALKGKPINKFGDGSSRRDYTYIDDFVSGFISALERPLGYQIFNLGNSQTVSLNEAIDIIERIAGKKLAIVQLEAQPGDVNITYADVSNARTKLGYNPNTSFEEGMKKFHQWFIENEI
jgi:UDP-glucuronate 4-epimerase